MYSHTTYCFISLEVHLGNNLKIQVNIIRYVHERIGFTFWKKTQAQWSEEILKPHYFARIGKATLVCAIRLPQVNKLKFQQLFWKFIVTLTKCNNYLMIVVVIQMSKQSCKILWYGFDPKYFAHIKRQPIGKDNLIAHIIVGFSFEWEVGKQCPTC